MATLSPPTAEEDTSMTASLCRAAQIVASLAVVSLVSPRADAGGVVKSWSNNAGGSFHTAANWSPLGAPTLTQTALFEAGTLYTVTFSNNVGNRLLRVDDLDLTLDLGGFLYSLTGASIGENAGVPGRLTLGNGTVLVSLAFPALKVRIGVGPGATGDLIISGNALFQSSNVILVGDGGSGLIAVDPGGRLTTAAVLLGDDPGADGTITVSGPGSTWTASGAVEIGQADQSTGCAVYVRRVVPCVGIRHLAGLDVQDGGPDSDEHARLVAAGDTVLLDGLLYHVRKLAELEGLLEEVQAAEAECADRGG